MRAVIDGKLYDTEAATLVAEWANGSDTSNFDYCEEELYVTPRGNWFLKGWGGARSKYGTVESDGWFGPGGSICPVSADEAMEWLEEKGETEALLAHFGDVIEAA